jgi:hypothetical protein
MHRALAAFLVAAALASEPALADTSGIVTDVYLPDGVTDAQPCVLFETSTTGTQFYAIPVVTSSSTLTVQTQAQIDKVSASRLLGLTIHFTVGAAVAACSNLPQAYDIRDLS